MRTTFSSLQGLADLPWFGLDDRRHLTTTDASIGPVIDMHTHLALAYVLPNRVDLQRKSEPEHYLPSCCKIDLDVYSNKNFREEDIARLKTDLTWKSLTSSGMRATHTVPNLVGEMDELRISHSVILPIDFPLLSDNAGTALRETKTAKGKLLSFGSVHPYSLDLEGKLDAQVRAGALGIKVHPNVQAVHPNDRRANRLYRLCGEHRIPVLMHCGPVGIEPALGRHLTQVRHYEAPIRNNPNTTFILGHAGALQADEALALQKRYKNVILETSCQSLGAIRTIVAEADPDRVVHGSDWPFYHQGFALAKVLIATSDKPELRRKFLFENAARLLRLS
jgi:uncharacterized protein